MSPRGRQPYLRVQFFLKRRPGMSLSDFHEHWENFHADLTLSLPGFKQVCKRYTQFHTLPEFQAKAALMGLPALDFDGSSELWLERMEGWAEFRRDLSKEILEALEKDEQHLFGGATHKLMIGYETLVHGEAVPGLPEGKQYKL